MTSQTDGHFKFIDIDSYLDFKNLVNNPIYKHYVDDSTPLREILTHYCHKEWRPLPQIHFDTFFDGVEIISFFSSEAEIHTVPGH